MEVKVLGGSTIVGQDAVMSDSSVMLSSLRHVALQLGFSSCRTVPSVRAPHAEEYLAWLDQGGHGSMAWLAGNPERRCDPALVLPGCQCVICLTYEYGGGAGAEHLGISRYARGVDYHRIMEAKLADLSVLLEMFGGEQRYYVDTGPVLERDFAELAGIGWRGRSGLIVREKGGSRFFLGTILTTLELPACSSVRNRCGSCLRCIQSCPTGALSGDGAMDARRCISYLTIENKEGIPEEMRPLIGTRIYGCDTCQDMCPWNGKPSGFGTDSLLFPSARLLKMKWRDMLALSEEEFAGLFRLSPIRRIKRRGLFRNICVALGNAGTPDDFSALEYLLDDDAMVREHARWAMERIGARFRISI